MKSILIGERYRPFLERSFECHGFEPVWMPDNPLLDPRLAGHADLSAIRLGDKLVVSRHLFENKLFVNLLTNRGIDVICCKREQKCAYPNDINLCACITGKHIIHNFTYTDPAVTVNSDCIRLNVNQGYANCMILALENKIITADIGIAAKAADSKIDVLKIKAGHIKLEGFNEGFIGGASFVYGNTVYFTGNIDTHPDSSMIKNYIAESGYKTLCLAEAELIDIGSAVMLDKG